MNKNKKEMSTMTVICILLSMIIVTCFFIGVFDNGNSPGERFLGTLFSVTAVVLIAPYYLGVIGISYACDKHMENKVAIVIKDIVLIILLAFPVYVVVTDNLKMVSHLILFAPEIVMVIALPFIIKSIFFKSKKNIEPKVEVNNNDNNNSNDTIIKQNQEFNPNKYIHCNSCGTMVFSGTEICPNCGNKI